MSAKERFTSSSARQIACVATVIVALVLVASQLSVTAFPEKELKKPLAAETVVQEVAETEVPLVSAEELEDGSEATDDSIVQEDAVNGVDENLAGDQTDSIEADASSTPVVEEETEVEGVEENLADDYEEPVASSPANAPVEDTENNAESAAEDVAETDAAVVGQDDAEPEYLELEYELPSEELEPDGDTDYDEIFSEYIEHRFDNELPSYEDEMVFTAQAISLTGNDLRAYNQLLPLIKQVAAGTRTSTTFTFALTDILTQTSWTPAELGVSEIVTNGSFNSTAMDNANKKVKINLSKLLGKLCNDLPYELYWYDKTASTSLSGISFSWNSRANILRATGNVTLKFPVAKSYQTSTYVFDSSKVSSVNTAVNKAKSIVEKYKGKSTYDRLLGYRKEICDLTSYNSAATKGGVAYGDPWQLVYVFDGNTSTTVVCEGYSKAFQYLCDLSGFTDAKCYTVTGTMSGGTGAGSHMWNIVTMPNGKNYLVDVTNCDAGTVGADTLLFLAGYASGSVSGGYTVNAKKAMTYKYDSDTTGYYTTAELTLNKGGYNQSSSGGSSGDSSGGSSSGSTSSGTSISGATIAVSNQTYTGSAHTPSPTVKLGTKTLTENTDYTVTYTNNVNAGTATAKITGKGNYSGTASKTFTISKKAQTVSVTSTKVSLAMGKTVNVGAKASAGGKLTYTSSNTAVATVSATGVITPKKVGTVTITAKAAATTNYAAASKSVAVTVTQGAQSITAANKYVVLNKTASIGAKTNGDGKLTYKSANTSIATVSSAGVITGKKVGTTKITITAAKTTNFKAASRTITVTVKRANPITATAKKATVTVSLSKLKSAAQTLANNLTVTKAQGTVSYSNASTNATAKKFTVNSTTGKVTIPKGTKAGTYPVIVKATAKGNTNYYSGSKSVTYKVQVR